MQDCFGVVGVPLNEDGEPRFRKPKTVQEERELVEKVIPSSTKYRNKWAVTIFGEWQISPSVIAPVSNPGGIFKDWFTQGRTAFYQQWSEMDAV